MSSSSSSTNRCSSSMISSIQHSLAGKLVQTTGNDVFVRERLVFSNTDLLIGRDHSRCQWVLHDPSISNKHLRIYVIVYDNDDPSQIDTLVYAEDLSRNGVYWNGSLIGSGNGGFLLSDGDTLKLSSNVFVRFCSKRTNTELAQFDSVQEKEMKHFQKHYTVTDRLLGAGAFGKVYMAVDKNTRSQLACKIVDLRQFRKQGKTRFGRPDEPVSAEDFDSRLQMKKITSWANEEKKKIDPEAKINIYLREAEILSTIKHPNIVGFDRVVVTNHTIYMFQDLVTGGDLFSYIQSKNGRLLEVEAAVIMRQVLIALSFLHDHNIVHRDLKPDNILMTNQSAGCRVVLTDFGAARRINTKCGRMLTMAGSVGYTAPEVTVQSQYFSTGNKAGYTRSVDMWSAGCVAVVLLTGTSAFNNPNTNKFCGKLAKEGNLKHFKTSAEWRNMRTRPKNLVENLLLLDEKKRLTAQQALDHVWFTNAMHKADFEDLYKRTIKNWHPRSNKTATIDFSAYNSKRKSSVPLFLKQQNDTSRKRRRIAIEPHFKPVSWKVDLAECPAKNTSPEFKAEVKKAIENWRQSSASFKINSIQHHFDNMRLQTTSPIHEPKLTLERPSQSNALMLPPKLPYKRLSVTVISDARMAAMATTTISEETQISPRPSTPQPTPDLQGEVVALHAEAAIPDRTCNLDTTISETVEVDVTTVTPTMTVTNSDEVVTKSIGEEQQNPKTTYRLKRPAITSQDGFRRPQVKRRRCSIYDLENEAQVTDENLVQFGNDRDFYHVNQDDYGVQVDASVAKDNEVTIPHHVSVSTKFEIDDTKFEDLYLPR